jgi:hypothetical protein
MITYDGRTLDDFGEITLSVSRVADPAPPSQPTKYLTTYTLGAKIYQPRASEVWDRIKSLQNLCETPEAALVITDDSGSSTTVRAQYISDNTAEVVARGRGELQMTFRAYERYDSKLHGELTATFTPSDSTQPKVFLGNVSGWAEQVSTEHYSRDHNARQRTTVTIDFSAAPYEFMPDPLTDLSNRLTAATTNLETFKGHLLGGMEGTLAYGSFSQVVRLDSVRPLLDDNAESISLAIQASYVSFPTGSYAQSDYTTATKEDCSTGKTTLTVSGDIQASSRAEAVAKLTEIRTLYQNDTNRLINEDKDERWINAEDVDEDTWLELSFSLEYLDQQADFIGFTLSINTTEDLDGGTANTVYSGSVTADSLTAARDKAREIGLFPELALSQSNETVDYETDCDGTQKFATFKFSYEYASENEFLGGEVTYERNDPTFGEPTRTVSGTISAPSFAAARSKARSFIGSGCLLRDKRESDSRKVSQDGSQTFVNFSFSYTLLRERSPSLNTSLRYTKSVEPDYESLTETASYSGSVWAANEALAEAAITTLKNTLLATNPSTSLKRKSISHRVEDAGEGECLVGTDFTLSLSRQITEEDSYNLIQASYTLERTPILPTNVITPVLKGYPVVQQLADTMTAGYQRLTARCSARTRGKAIAWGQALRSRARTDEATGQPGYEMAGSGKETIEHVFNEGDQTSTSPVRYEYSVAYDYAFNTAGLQAPMNSATSYVP